MKPNALFSPAPITRAVVLEKLQQLDKQLRDKRSERDALRATLPTIIAGAAGSDLAAKRERKRLAELAEEIRDLQAAEPVLHAALADLEHEEHVAQFEARRKAVMALAEAHEAAAAEAQRYIETLAPALQRYQSSYDVFRKALHQLGSLREEVGTTEHYDKLSAHVGLSLFVATDGRIRTLSRIFDTPLQLTERGWGSLVPLAHEHLTLCLRAMPHPPVHHTPPEAA